MVQKIIMPSGGQTTDEMLIQRWNKNPGDPVKRGDILFEIETDKASMPVESFAEGTLLAIIYKEGTLVKAGETVAYIGDPGEKIPEEPVNLNFKQEAKEFEPTLLQDNVADIEIKISGNSQQKKDLKIIYASPLAKNKAKIENISLEDIANYCSKNLIKKADIDNYIREKQSSDGKVDSYLLDTTSMRRTVAKRMKESVLTSPHYTVSVDIDMTEVIRMRKKLNDYLTDNEYRITYNDILMKIAAKAIEAFPLINSSYQEEKIKVFKDINFGLAVGLENGLIVPVVKQVNKKSISEIAATNTRNIAAAKNNKLEESDITGGTITLSNLGMFGINNFTAVINQPESCILAIGGIIEKPVVKDHQIVIKEMMNITGSFDHRVIDGTLGAAFLNRIKEFLENPRLLFFDPEKYLFEK
ncbi:MAG: 2-oxo acid dehydrogenase subunit E2 [Bacteroidales bacterium]|nr:2-oxo acid dehydrogenase subunit E2 [Bacteroidales bacterium]